MRIVIVGAGDIGTHLASLLSHKGHGVFLIDHDPGKLQEASRDLDIGTKRGSGTDWRLLEELLGFSPDLLLAFTDNDETNLISSSIAKQLGYPQTVARIRQGNYINCSRLDFGRLFQVDHLLSPELLVAYDILKSLLHGGALFVENFAHGAIQMRTVVVPHHWRKNHLNLAKLELPQGLMIGLIRRIEEGKAKVILPHGEDHLLAKDEATFVGEAKLMANLHQFFSLTKEKVQSVVIVGGSLIGTHLAELLASHHIRVRLIDKEYENCRALSERLPHTTILHQSGTNLDFLIEQNVQYADAFVACTRRDEINLLAANLARSAGCQNTIVSLSDTHYLPIAKDMGIHNAFSPRLSSENRILSLMSPTKVRSKVSLYGEQAEIMEVEASLDSKLTGIPIEELSRVLPKDFLFSVIQNRGRVFVPNGRSVLSPGDTVIAITHPRHAEEMQSLF